MTRFLSGDWGSSSFRLRLVDTHGQKVLAEYRSEQGITGVSQLWKASGQPDSERIEFYKNILAQAIAGLHVPVDQDLPVILSGMASSSIGMAELPYQHFPFTWDASQLIVRKIAGLEKFKHPVFLVSGYRTEADVMRGEETKLFGFDVSDTGDNIIIFPGTHSKHVFVRNKIAQGFKTYMTGEIFNLLSKKSILQYAVRKGIEKNGFEEGFRAAMQGNLLHEAFMVRTRQLLQKVNPENNYQYLSGLLIGAELRDLKNPGCPVFLITGEHLKTAYGWGLEMLNLKQKAVLIDGDDLLIKGQCKLAAHYL